MSSTHLPQGPNDMSDGNAVAENPVEFAGGEASPAGTSGPQCQCGYGLEHHFVALKFKYSMAAWVLLVMGVSAMPKCGEYVCARCGETLAKETDRRKLAAMRMYA